MNDLATADPRPAISGALPAQAGAAGLYWLPVAPPDWAAQIKALDAATDLAPQEAWKKLVALANLRMDFIRTGRLDRSLQRLFGTAPPPGLDTKPLRLAVLGSSTLAHLLPAIRIGALRRGLWVTTYEADYGQYMQELADPGSALHAFAPNFVLFALDAQHLMRGVNPAATQAQADATLADITNHVAECWTMAQAAFRCPVLHQATLPVFPALLGSNEHRLPGSPGNMVLRLNAALRQRADGQGVDILALDDRAATDGIRAWHDPVLWLRAKQEVGPLAAPLYGDLVGRLLAARQGRSFKCMVLDLDNTLWGGVIGDDGLEGIALGQGSALGEAFVAFQNYARDQARRGIILAVCSKNDEANALSPFEKHPDMVLRRTDIACFVANWNDKAGNIRSIAQQLNIGLDSLVFVDDNPFERNLVRGELPMVAVPEVPEDPALFAACLADAGYFESLGVTDEDRLRSAQYQANLERAQIASQAADLPTYLRSLDMELVWNRFDRVGLQRIVQLINKTNQFNLTTKRYTEEDVLAVMDDPASFGLQLRLLDRFGDNGIIAIIIGRAQADGDLLLDTWLMSCRVLGRQVEEVTLAIIMDEAVRLGARRLLGEYRPTAKNGMVREHYAKLGFAPVAHAEDGTRLDALAVAAYQRPEIFMKIREA